MKLLVAPSLIVRAAVLGNIVANALTAALLPRMSVVFYGDSLPGAWAAALWLAAAQLMPVWDVGYTAAGLILFCLFGARFIGRPDKAVRFGAWTGAAAGMLFLLNPASLLIDLPWIAYLIGRRNLPWAQAARYSGALLAILLLIISSWALRNRHQMGALVVRTNLGMTLYASNNDCAQASLAEDMREGCYQTHHPNTSTSEAILFRTLGEVEYDRRRTVDAENWALGHPRRFGCLTAERFRYFWFPPLGEHEFRTGAIWLATALSIPGIFLMLKHRLPVVVFVATVQLIYPLMYYVVVSDVRYRYPVLWLSLLPAGYFIASLHTARYGADRCPPPSQTFRPLKQTKRSDASPFSGSRAQTTLERSIPSKSRSLWRRMSAAVRSSSFDLYAERQALSPNDGRRVLNNFGGTPSRRVEAKKEKRTRAEESKRKLRAPPLLKGGGL